MQVQSFNQRGESLQFQTKAHIRQLAAAVEGYNQIHYKTELPYLIQLNLKYVHGDLLRIALGIYNRTQTWEQLWKFIHAIYSIHKENHLIKFFISLLFEVMRANSELTRNHPDLTISLRFSPNEILDCFNPYQSNTHLETMIQALLLDHLSYFMKMISIQIETMNYPSKQIQFFKLKAIEIKRSPLMATPLGPYLESKNSTKECIWIISIIEKMFLFNTVTVPQHLKAFQNSQFRTSAVEATKPEMIQFRINWIYKPLLLTLERKLNTQLLTQLCEHITSLNTSTIIKEVEKLIQASSSSIPLNISLLDLAIYWESEIHETILKSYLGSLASIMSKLMARTLD